MKYGKKGIIRNVEHLKETKIETIANRRQIGGRAEAVARQVSRLKIRHAIQREESEYQVVASEDVGEKRFIREGGDGKFEQIIGDIELSQRVEVGENQVSSKSVLGELKSDDVREEVGGEEAIGGGVGNVQPSQVKSARIVEGT